MGALHRFIFGQGGSTPATNQGRKRGGPWFYLLCPLPIFFSLMAFAWPHLQAVRLGYDFQRLQVERSQLAQLKAELKVERAALRSPSRIEKVARRDLGMVDPSPDQLIWVRLSSKGVSPSRGGPGWTGDP